MNEAADLRRLLQIIDYAPKQTVKESNILDDPVRIYLTIKALYQKFKRQHMLEYMQGAVFEVQKPPQRPRRCLPYTEVTAIDVLRHRRHTNEDLLQMVDIKQFLGRKQGNELYDHIIANIDSLVGAEQVLNCSLALMGKEYQRGNMEYYQLVQEKMIVKISTIPLKGTDFKVIARKLCKLPLIKQPILILISHLFDKVPRMQDFQQLFTIFKGIFPSQPTFIDVQALIRICHDQTLSAFISIVERNDQMARFALQVAQNIAKVKLSMLPVTLTGKTRCTLNFVIQVTKFGRLIWEELIEWESKASQESQQYLKEGLQGFLIESVHNSRNLAIILSIVDKMARMKERPRICLVVCHELFKVKTQQLLSHKIIRHFLAGEILKQYNPEHPPLVFHPNLLFIDVLLQFFTFPAQSIKKFYVSAMSVDETLKLFTPFFKQLCQDIPTKFKQTYLEWYSMDKVDILTNNLGNVIAQNLDWHLTFEIAVGLVRDLAGRPPNKHLVCTLNRFFNAFKAPKQLAILRKQVARSLNIILVNSNKQTLNNTFKITLPAFIRDHLMSQKQNIFENVPEDIKFDLKNAYEHYLLNKKK